MTTKKLISAALISIVCSATNSFAAAEMKQEDVDASEKKMTRDYNLSQFWDYVHRGHFSDAAGLLQYVNENEASCYISASEMVNNSPEGFSPPLSFIIPLPNISDQEKIVFAELLVYYGAKINANFSEASNAIATAVRYNNISLLEYFLRRGPFTLLQEDLLSSAVVLHDPEKKIARLLLDKCGVEPKPFDAVWLNDMNLLDRILSNSDDESADLAEALKTAISRGDQDMIRAILERGAEPTPEVAVLLDDPRYLGEANGSIIKTDSLKRALSLGHMRIAAELIQRGVSSEEICRDLVKYGNLASLQRLLDLNINVRFIDGQGRSLIMMALEKKAANLVEVVDLLIKKGVNVLQRDWRGDTATHYAVHLHNHERSAEILALLQQARARLDARNNKGNTPIFEANRVGNLHAETYLRLFGKAPSDEHKASE